MKNSSIINMIRKSIYWPYPFCYCFRVSSFVSTLYV